MYKEKKLALLTFFMALGFMLILGGCGGTTVAPELLKQPTLKAPLVNKNIQIKSPINSNLDRAEKVEESIKESLDIALTQANLFNRNSKDSYKLIATTQIFSQSPMSFGKFGNKLQINYQLFSNNGTVLINKTIFTIAESDKFIFSGAERSERARAVNIAKNVNQFMKALRTKLR